MRNVKRFSHVIRYLVAGICVAIGTIGSGCGSASGNAAVAALGVGAGVPLLTHSRLNVTVEVFQDTNLCPDDKKNPFKLPHSAALVERALAESNPINYPTLANMTRAESSAANRLGKLEFQKGKILENIRKNQSPRHMGDDEAEKALHAITIGRKNLIADIDDAAAAVDEFQTSVSDATHPEPTEVETLAMVRSLGSVRAAFAHVQRSAKSLENAWRDYRKAAQRLLTDPAALSNALTKLDKLKASTREQLKNRTPPTSNAFQPEFSPADEQLSNDLSSADLVNAQTLGQDLAQAGLSLQNAQATSMAATNFLFDGLLSDSNFGPLVNEIMQEVMSRSRAIDLMVDERYKGYWRPFQSASSWNGPGDQNTVIYLENMGTPILKTGSFDPGQFIAAFGNLYRVALTSLASTVVQPLGSGSTANPKTGGTGSSTGNGTGKDPGTTTPTTTTGGGSETGSSPGASSGSAKPATGTAGKPAAAKAPASSTSTGAAKASSVLTADSDTAAANDSAAKSKAALLAAFKAILDAHDTFDKVSDPTRADAAAVVKALTQSAAALDSSQASN